LCTLHDHEIEGAIAKDLVRDAHSVGRFGIQGLGPLDHELSLAGLRQGRPETFQRAQVPGP
jgi:hypothetical protein